MYLIEEFVDVVERLDGITASLPLVRRRAGSTVRDRGAGRKGR